MKGSPSFQFYPSDFETDENVKLMNNREIGCYVLLMCSCWREGSIPNDLRKISALCNEDPEQMRPMWKAIKPCFQKGDPGRLVHPRLEKERAKQAEFRAKRSEAGRKGNRKRWGNLRPA